MHTHTQHNTHNTLGLTTGRTPRISVFPVIRLPGREPECRQHVDKTNYNYSSTHFDFVAKNRTGLYNYLHEYYEYHKFCKCLSDVLRVRNAIALLFSLV